MSLFEDARQTTVRPIKFLNPIWQETVTSHSCPPFTMVLDTMAQALGAINILAIWHEDGETPARMQWHAGRAADVDLAIEMVAAACQFASKKMERVDWRVSDDGSHGMTIMAFPVHEGTVTVTALFPSLDDLTRSVDAKMAVQNWPMLGPFFALWALHLKAAAREGGFAQASDLLDIAIFHFDDRGRLLFGNAAGSALVASQAGIRRSGSSLGGTSLAETIALQSAIDDAIDVDGAITSGAENRIVALSREGRRPLLAAAVSIGHDKALQGGTAAILHVIDTEHDLEARLAPACKLYRLSPVETRLACILADGATLADACKVINIREQTARSYLKQIFSKTATTRQAELVRLLVKSAVLTMPTPRPLAL